MDHLKVFIANFVTSSLLVNKGSVDMESFYLTNNETKVENGNLLGNLSSMKSFTKLL